VTGVQTCALPISDTTPGHRPALERREVRVRAAERARRGAVEIVLPPEGPAGGGTGERPEAGALELLLAQAGRPRRNGGLPPGTEARPGGMVDLRVRRAA